MERKNNNLIQDEKEVDDVAANILEIENYISKIERLDHESTNISVERA